MLTRDAYLRPKERYAETKAPTVIEQGDSAVEGIGARVYLAEKRYELLSGVKGRYVPDPE
jgi:lipopolysaccharide export system protein LptC